MHTSSSSRPDFKFTKSMGRVKTDREVRRQTEDLPQRFMDRLLG
jgi:hypothetical protein